MQRYLYQLVDRLAEADISRNRHFDLLSSPIGERARRIHRRLCSLRDDLQRHGSNASLQLRRHRIGVELRMEVRSIKLVRTAWLTREDLDVLARHAGPLLEAALAEVG